MKNDLIRFFDEYIFDEIEIIKFTPLSSILILPDSITCNFLSIYNAWHREQKLLLRSKQSD